MKIFYYLSVLLLIFILSLSCAHYQQSRVRIKNLNDKDAINVYIGGKKYKHIKANSKTDYEFISVGKFRVKGSFEVDEDTTDDTDDDSFDEKIEIEWGSLYSVLIDDNYVKLEVDQDFDSEQLRY